MGVIRLLASFGLMAGLAACSESIQTTSGGDYIANYEQAARIARDEQSLKALDRKRSGSAEADRPRVRLSRSVRDLNDMVLEAASVEPLLTFPARIGVARISGGRRTTIPPHEAEAWFGLATLMDGEIGELVPVSNAVADMASSAVGLRTGNLNRHQEALAKIRLGAARQHLDAVIIYEAFANANSQRSWFSVIDYTLVGSFLVPTHFNKAEAIATAIIMDVRNGYMYATVTAAEEATELSRYWTRHEGERSASQRATADVSQKLAERIGETMFELRRRLTVKRAVDAAS
jgi:hypothetical protein